jgi:hypothetical protein
MPYKIDNNLYRGKLKTILSSQRKQCGNTNRKHRDNASFGNQTGRNGIDLPARMCRSGSAIEIKKPSSNRLPQQCDVACFYDGRAISLPIGVMPISTPTEIL